MPEEKRITAFMAPVSIHVEKIPEFESSQSSETSLDSAEDYCELVDSDNTREQNFTCQVAHKSNERQVKIQDYMMRN